MAILPSGRAMVTVDTATNTLPAAVRTKLNTDLGVDQKLTKPATPSTDQMVVLKSDGTVVTQAIPSGGSTVTATETAAGSGLYTM